MTNCDRAILLGENKRWPRFCRLPIGHRGQHECVYLLGVIRFDTPKRAPGDEKESRVAPGGHAGPVRGIPGEAVA